KRCSRLDMSKRPSTVLQAARRHSAVATTPHAYKMASSYLLESNANGCRRRVPRREPVGGRARTSCYGFHPVATKTGRSSNGLTQLVEGSTTTAARRE